MISVILPYFNAEPTLDRAIQSILDQTFEDFELILINNNSIDGSFDIAASFAQQDTRIKCLNEQQQGVVYAANTGMKAASGKYMARMDADDVAHPQRLEQQVIHLESNPAISISATQVNYKTNNPKIGEFQHFVDWSNSLNSRNDIYANRFVEFPVVNPTLMFRKELLHDIGYLKNEDFPEDYEWFLRAIEAGHMVEKLPKPLLDWHDSENRLTRSDLRYRNDAFFKIKTEYLTRHLKAISQTKVWIWGAGKLSLKRSQFLLDHGIIIEGYIDIKAGKRVSGYPCVHFEMVSIKAQTFILSYVSNRGKRDEIRQFLNARNYSECKSYLVVG